MTRWQLYFSPTSRRWASLNCQSLQKDHSDHTQQGLGEPVELQASNSGYAGREEAKRAAMRVERQQSDLSWRKSLAEKTPEAERSPEQKADIKAYNNIQFAAQFDYQDDWQDDEES